jgi:hypothetical protein
MERRQQVEAIAECTANHSISGKTLFHRRFWEYHAYVVATHLGVHFPLFYKRQCGVLWKPSCADWMTEFP